MGDIERESPNAPVGAATNRRNRRGVVGAFAAAMLGATGLATLGGEADAKRRKGGGKRDKNRCKKGKLVDRVHVPADGGSIGTKPLAKGQTYTLRVSGYVIDDEWGIDGEYYFLLADPGDRSEVYDRCDSGVPVGVEISGAAFSGWGPYTEDHLYEAKVKGKGQPLFLRLRDCAYGDQTGTLLVEVRCG